LVAEARKYGGLDVVVNNVGAVALRLEGFASVTDDQWLSSFNLKLHDGRADNARGVAAPGPAE
jgi:NAD(P)-dependent dehydrogenase (short-subunit alcohol dehydrogenase family)